MPTNHAQTITDIHNAMLEMAGIATTPNPIITPDLNTSGWTSPYMPSGTTYYIPAGFVLNNGLAPTLSYTGDVTAQGIQFLSRQMINEFYGIKEHHEYSSITMGSEGSYMPIIFDVEYV